MKLKATLLLILICLSACSSENKTEESVLGAANAECLVEDQQLKERETINSFISDSKQCQTDSDCKLVFLDCPFGCGTALNIENVEKVQSMVDQYNQNACYGCDYDCAYQTEVKCVENACIASHGLMKELEPSEN